MSTRSFFLPEDVSGYIMSVSLRDTEVQRELREETSRMKHSGMQTGPDQVQFLQLLVRLIDAKRCLEVGVFTGYSALGVAMALPDDGHIVACDISEEYTSVGCRYWERAGMRHKIDLRLGPAVQTLDELLTKGEGGTYDFAYIDADKSNYDAYYERVLRLLRRNGLIAIDNVLWGGEVVKSDTHDEDTDALRELNVKMGRDDRVDASLLTIGDGLTLARKR